MIVLQNSSFEVLEEHLRWVYRAASGLPGLRALHSHRSVLWTGVVRETISYQGPAILCEWHWVISQLRLKLKFSSFQFKTYSPAFTQIEIWFRCIFLLSSFACAVSEEILLIAMVILIKLFLSVLVRLQHAKIRHIRLVHRTKVGDDSPPAAHPLRQWVIFGIFLKL